MSRLFISYAHVDKRQVRELAEILQDGGHEAWFDHGLVVGRDWKEQLLEEITHCEAFIYALTPESVASEWCQWEFEQAVLLGKPIIPVLMQKNTTLPDALKRNQYADFSDGPTPKATAKLLHGVYSLAVTVPRDALPKILTEPAGTPEKAKPDVPHPNIKIKFDIGKAMTLFYEAKKNMEWFRAKELLEDIESYGNVPTWIKLEQLRSDIQPEIDRLEEELRREAERREAEHRQQELEEIIQQQYNLIRLIAAHDSPTRVWESLQEFWAGFGHYDPDNLAVKFRPNTPDQQKLLDLIADVHTKSPERAKAGRRLAEIGDPRSGVGLGPDGLPDMDWVEVPAGEFIFGGDGKAFNGLPYQKLYLDAFYMARYPVTYSQYLAFVNAKDGYRNRNWWDGFTYLTLGAYKQRWRIPNYPCENVTWYEAIAFCRWLGTKLKLDLGLPTEQQWEKGARGIDGRVFPWGNEYIRGYANIDEKGSGVGPYYRKKTTAVGIYQQGMSPYKILDMSGNVWEWCSNEFKNPTDIRLTADTRRVIRGGAWLFGDRVARVTSRFRGSTNGRSDVIGFRVVCNKPF